MDASIWTIGGAVTWPRDPTGYLFLGRAVTMLGKSMFANWTDTDPAKAFRFPEPEPLPPKQQFGGRSMTYGSRPAPSLADDMDSFRRRHDAWEQSLIELRYENEMSAPAIARAKAVYSRIISEAETGSLKTAYRDDLSGLMVDMPLHWWNGDFLGHRFSAGGFDPRRPFSADYQHQYRRWLFVEETGLRRLAGEATDESRLAAPSARLPTDSAEVRAILPLTAKANDRKHEEYAHRAAQIVRDTGVLPAAAFREVAPVDNTRTLDSITHAIRKPYDMMYDRHGQPINIDQN